MAENKKSFLLYCDQIGIFNQLPDDIAGKLIKHIFQYVNDENPETEDLLIKIAFESIKNQLKRDLKKYEQFIDKQRENGLKGGRPKNPKKPKETQKTHGLFSKPKKTDTDIVIDNVIDIVKDIIYYLNNTCKTKYLDTSEKTKELIKARLNQGFTLEDFKTVIDKKYREWGRDARMIGYLRPETLFSNKFESYLNQIEIKTETNYQNGINIDEIWK